MVWAAFLHLSRERMRKTCQWSRSSLGRGHRWFSVGWVVGQGTYWSELRSEIRIIRGLQCRSTVASCRKSVVWGSAQNQTAANTLRSFCCHVNYESRFPDLQTWMCHFFRPWIDGCTWELFYPRKSWFLLTGLRWVLQNNSVGSSQLSFQFFRWWRCFISQLVPSFRGNISRFLLCFRTLFHLDNSWDRILCTENGLSTYCLWEHSKISRST